MRLPLFYRGLRPGAAVSGFFVCDDSRTPSVIKSLYGLRGRKHRLTLTPVASRPNFQRGIGQHVRDSGDDSTGMDESLASGSARRSIKCASGRG
jgi:hypothetical protein